MLKTIPSTTLRNNLSDALDATKKEKVLVVSRYGDAETALVDLDYLEDLLALRSKKYIASIKRARADIKAGRLYSHGQVFGEL